jgi:hypothetical protein
MAGPVKIPLTFKIIMIKILHYSRTKRYETILSFLALLTSNHHHMKSKFFFHKLYNFSEKKMNENEKQLFLAGFYRFKHSPILNTQGLSGKKKWDELLCNIKKNLSFCNILNIFFKRETFHTSQRDSRLGRHSQFLKLLTIYQQVKFLKVLKSRCRLMRSLWARPYMIPISK